MLGARSARRGLLGSPGALRRRTTREQPAAVAAALQNAPPPADGKRNRPAGPSGARGAPERSAQRTRATSVGNGENREVAKSWDKIIRWGRINVLRQQQQGADSDVLERTTKVAVFGGGSFGTAMAAMLAKNKPAGLDVVILVRNEEQARSINEEHRNTRYLPKFELPPSVRATTDAQDAIDGAQYIVHAVPVQSSAAFLEGVKDVLPPHVPILSLSKGLEVGTSRMMSEVIPAGLGRDQPTVFLSGPTFAVELMGGLPTAIVAASKVPGLATEAQQLFAGPFLRVNTSNDVVGVEIAGALKNVLAIAAGVVVGLDLGNNALAALVAQGVAEIRWLACKMGAKQATLTGLSGVGDIMLTCFVDLSRNRTVGVRLGSGETIEHILETSSQVAEGVATASSVVELADRYHVALPVLTAVAKMCDGQLTPREAVEQIMGLPQVAEV